MSESLDKYFSTLKPITLEEAAKTGEHFVIWTSENARLELSPEEYSKLTKSLSHKVNIRAVTAVVVA